MHIAKRLLALLFVLCLRLPLARAETAPTPSACRCGRSDCYWETPMDISDEAAVWAMLTAPMTVIAGNQKTQVQLYAAPDASAQPVADVTCASQGVHVLSSAPDGWSLVECYSSSFKGSRVKAWNQLTQGYVKTSLLVEKAVKTHYGLVVDKLTQRMYVFENGALLDTLLISTGLPSEGREYNETRSGEFLLCSRVGQFSSDDLLCSYAIRFNDGDLLHEVPHTKLADGSRVYKAFEIKLGQRASHGCIRVQRLRTPQGHNMKWLWRVLAKEMGTRLVLWEDTPERTLQVPPDDTPLYWAEQDARYYHASPTCYGAAQKLWPLTAFTYGELDAPPYDELSACPWCGPPVGSR